MLSNWNLRKLFLLKCAAINKLNSSNGDFKEALRTEEIEIISMIRGGMQTAVMSAAH